MKRPYEVRSPLVLVVAEEGAVVGGVGFLCQREQQSFAELQRQRELTQDLPHAVQEQQEGRALVLQPGVRVSRVSAALLKRVTCLTRRGGNVIFYRRAPVQQC